jgi:hypothetical protein
MFIALLITAAAIAIVGAIAALDGSRDVFHPLILVGPMLAFLYGWMPWKLVEAGGLPRFFDGDQLLFVQTLFVLGVLAFVVGCLGAGVRVSKSEVRRPRRLSTKTLRRLQIGGAIAGTIGLVCWAISIINVGGFVAAYSTSYSGGWDDSGYIRDGSILLLVGVMMAMMTRSAGGPRWPSYAMLAAFGLPWLATAVLMARRGPTFELVLVLVMGWYVNRSKRPPLVAVGVAGCCVGWLVLFLVTNRQSIYIGSDHAMTTDVSEVVETPDTGNEWIYGAGTVLSSQRRDHYYWMRRYLAQILVRPIPSSVWPTKYEDFGVPELLFNAGTGQGFGDTLGWEGAVGAAPGIVADLWVEVWWFAIPFMALLGWIYGYTWRKAVTRGGPWSSQLVVLSAITIYMVMQTMEAVIFRTLLLSIPCWIIWRWALPAPARIRRNLSRRRLQATVKRAPLPAGRFENA